MLFKNKNRNKSLGYEIYKNNFNCGTTSYKFIFISNTTSKDQFSDNFYRQDYNDKNLNEWATTSVEYPKQQPGAILSG